MTEPTAVPSVPKAELHVHLEAGAAPDLVRRNAARYGVDVSRLFDDEASVVEPRDFPACGQMVYPGLLRLL